MKGRSTLTTLATLVVITLGTLTTLIALGAADDLSFYEELDPGLDVGYSRFHQAHPPLNIGPSLVLRSLPLGCSIGEVWRVTMFL